MHGLELTFFLSFSSLLILIVLVGPSFLFFFSIYVVSPCISSLVLGPNLFFLIIVSPYVYHLAVAELYFRHVLYSLVSPTSKTYLPSRQNCPFHFIYFTFFFFFRRGIHPYANRKIGGSIAKLTHPMFDSMRYFYFCLDKYSHTQHKSTSPLLKGSIWQ